MIRYFQYGESQHRSHCLVVDPVWVAVRDHPIVAIIATMNRKSIPLEGEVDGRHTSNILKSDVVLVCAWYFQGSTIVIPTLM